MNELLSEVKMSADKIVASIGELIVNRATPFLVAIDGGSGSGKSSVARLVAESLDATLIPSDDFFAAEIPDAGWEKRNAEERARDAIDWRRLRRDVLEPLLAGKVARWHAFDFVAGIRPDGTYAMNPEAEERNPSAVIVLDGAYSTRPELADLIDFSVLIDVPIEMRYKRLAGREPKEFLDAWHERWDGAEEYYFTHVRPRHSFDLVISEKADPK